MKMKYLTIMILALSGCTRSPEIVEEFHPSPPVKHPLAPAQVSTNQIDDPLLVRATEAVRTYLAKRPHLNIRSIQKRAGSSHPHYTVYFEPEGDKVYMPLSAILVDGKWEMRWAIH